MEVKAPVQIIEEIRELCAQYAQEVPSRRRTWPKSIKERVLQLLQLELSCESAARQTGIPVATIYGWKSAGRQTPAAAVPAQSFLPMKVVAKPMIAASQVKSPAVAVKPEARRRYRKRSHAATIVIVTLSGIRFEGLDISSALRLAERLGIARVES